MRNASAVPAKTDNARGGVFSALTALFGDAALVVFYVIANRKVRG